MMSIQLPAQVVLWTIVLAIFPAPAANGQPSATVADLVATAPNAKGIWDVPDKNNTAVHIQSGMTCKLSYLGGILLQRVSVDDVPPRGDAVSCWFKSNGKGMTGGVTAVFVFSVRRSDTAVADDSRSIAIADFIRAHAAATVDQPYVELNATIHSGGEIYKPKSAKFKMGGQLRGYTFFLVAEGWLVRLDIVEPDGSGSQALVAPILLTDIVSKIVAKSKANPH
jgi:hypothetical protein